ncbi:hypothetical protein Verru16b_02857 [Lacunisphaera limnophila]|uniref:Uncharacterized protein n=1 Tax=Lacunisphaera limnophila TaxID=1838286 RepID=A0A1D8AXZ7_9BACT|nr:hypothetical protein [Lacunisphaera limnophila]AOS45769.1 hypothetical protein Verru16b_02857 [Lacunisphaera limnophila]
MSTLSKRAALRIVLPGLVLGGLCGAAVGFKLVPVFFGVTGAAAVGVTVGLLLYRARKKSGL